jgi:hypothetical protein
MHPPNSNQKNAPNTGGISRATQRKLVPRAQAMIQVFD